MDSGLTLWVAINSARQNKSIKKKQEMLWSGASPENDKVKEWEGNQDSGSHNPKWRKPTKCIHCITVSKMGVREKIDAYTDWPSPIIEVSKKGLHMWWLHPVEQSHPLWDTCCAHNRVNLGKLAGAKVISKLDTNNSFWKSMQRNLESLPGVECQMDDIIVYGANQEDHDARLEAVLIRLQDTNITLNGEKCEFSKASIRFLGQIFKEEGIRADPSREAVVKNMAEPTDIHKLRLRRFLWMVNQSDKYIFQPGWTHPPTTRIS